jgi:Nucleotide modification associated domain 2
VRLEYINLLLIQVKAENDGKSGGGFMPTLFSYCIRYDIGSAPNPFWGLRTLAICKPNIRQSANVGDWVAGTGSAVSPIGNISDKVVYAMRVTHQMTMEDYDRFT